MSETSQKRSTYRKAGTNDMAIDKQNLKGSRSKKKLKSTEGSGYKPQPQRGVIREVSGLILDEIKEETNVTVDKTEETNSVVDKPVEVKINKILVRTPIVSLCADNGSSSGTDTPVDTAIGVDKENSVDTNTVTDKDKDGVPPKMKLNREVSFSAQSEQARSPTKRPPSKRNKRPKSAMRFTKEDMEVFLPRKSFFNSHDKILSEAGHQVDLHKERKKPDWRRILRMHTMEELYPPKIESEADKEEATGLRDDESDSSEDELFSLEKTETLLSKENKRTRSKSKKRDGNPEREEYKPLYDYLKYILDNPEEYITTSKFTAKNLDHKHPNNMVRMGRIYRRGSNVRNSIYLHALSRLKPANSDAQVNTQDESELTKFKVKAEIWLRDLPTQQYLRAKELALKDVGEEDINHTKWWLAFKTCSYIRIPKHTVIEKL